MKGRNILGYLHLLDWTTIDLTTGLDYWTGLLDHILITCYTKHTY